MDKTWNAKKDVREEILIAHTTHAQTYEQFFIVVFELILSKLQNFQPFSPLFPLLARLKVLISPAPEIISFHYSNPCRPLMLEK